MKAASAGPRAPSACFTIVNAPPTGAAGGGRPSGDGPMRDPDLRDAWRAAGLAPGAERGAAGDDDDRPTFHRDVPGDGRSAVRGGPRTGGRPRFRRPGLRRRGCRGCTCAEAATHPGRGSADGRTGGTAVGGRGGAGPRGTDAVIAPLTDPWPRLRRARSPPPATRWWYVDALSDDGALRPDASSASWAASSRPIMLGGGARANGRSDQPLSP